MTSTPARTSSLSFSSESDAGPIVATIRVRRTGFPSFLLPSLGDEPPRPVESSRVERYCKVTRSSAREVNAVCRFEVAFTSKLRPWLRASKGPLFEKFFVQYVEKLSINSRV